MKKKIFFFIADGLGDLPCRALGGKTPLEAAKTPNLDKLAGNGLCGLLVPQGLGKTVPLEDASLMTFSLLGYDMEKLKPKRGPLEVIGLGKKYKNGELAARCNFAHIEKGTVKSLRVTPSKSVERRIGRLKLSVPFSFHRGPAHRAVVVFHGRFGDDVSKVDPHLVGKKVAKCRALDKKSEKAARIVNEFVEKSASALIGAGANFVLPRGFGSRLPRVEKFSKKYGLSAAGVGASPVDVGILKICGIGSRRKDADLVIVHYKDADPPAHRGDAAAKKKAIEKFDKTLSRLPEHCVVVVTADHCTPCKKKGHSADPIPCLISFGGDGKGKRKFGEKFCRDFNIPQKKLVGFVSKQVLQ